ncbi:MAG TPA: hypothetical protein VK933_04920 [Longimicrobiales bacterium]|nr:hypothetical protein [Longimicrobiales bacterium]
MDQFEYLSVLISIILGLGITQLLTGFGRWLEQRATFKAYGPAIGWAAFLLIVHVQTWWSMFGLRHWPDWNFLQFALVLLQPSILFLMAILAFPGPNSSDDLRANYFVQRRWFFGLLMALLVVSVLKDLIRSGDLPDALNLLFHGVFFTIAATGFAAESGRVHRRLAVAGLASIAVYILVLFATLGSL